jgi:hypothetical protein
MYESSIQALAERHPEWLFPTFALRLLNRQMALTGGYLDVLYEDAEGTWWVTELKRGRLAPADVRQVLRYWVEVKALNPSRSVHSMLVGLEASDGAKRLAHDHGVHVELISNAHLHDCILRAGIDDADARPRSNKLTAARPSQTRGPGLARQRNPERERLQRLLDSSWPPGTLGAASTRQSLLEYWATACPNAPDKYRQLVTDLCLAILPTARGLCLSNRASAWTTVRLPNQRMLAAVNADSARVKFDFPMPDVMAEQARDAGLVRLDQSRQGGYWVAALGINSTQRLQAALALFRDSMKVMAGPGALP